MVYVKLISGLGNQLFQYTVGRQLAIKENVGLKLDVSFFDKQNLRSYKLDHFNINANIASSSEVSSFLSIYQRNTRYAQIFRKVERILPKYKRRYFKENEWWVYEQDLFKISSKVYLDGYWQHYRYFENMPSQIFDELTLKDVVYLNNQKVFHDIVANDNSISIHIRRGDYITDINAQKLMGVLSLSYYEQAISHIKKYFLNPTFYIFSDDLNWAYDHLKGFGKVVAVDIDNGCRDYVELYLMSKCQHNIIANSTFSWWGAVLNRNPSKIVIAPKQWVIPEEINQKIHLQFPSWIRL